MTASCPAATLNLHPDHSSRREASVSACVCVQEIVENTDEKQNYIMAGGEGGTGNCASVFRFSTSIIRY